MFPNREMLKKELFPVQFGALPAAAEQLFTKPRLRPKIEPNFELSKGKATKFARTREFKKLTCFFENTEISKPPFLDMDVVKTLSIKVPRIRAPGNANLPWTLGRHCPGPCPNLQCGVFFEIDNYSLLEFCQKGRNGVWGSKELYRKGNSLKRFRPFSEWRDSKRSKSSVLIRKRPTVPNFWCHL